MEVIVEYDYKADELDELTIKKGEIIKNVSQFEDGWYIGTLNGKTGVFPDNFVKILTKNSQNNISNGKAMESQINEPIENGKKLIGIGLGNIFSGQQIQLKQLSINDAKRRMNEEGNAIKADEEQKRSDHKEEEKVRVRFAYTPKHPDEISLHIDDVIVILDKNLPDEGWWKGYNQRTKATGLFPDNFVEPMVQKSQETNPRTNQSSMVNARSHPSLNVQSTTNNPAGDKQRIKSKLYKNSDLFSSELAIDNPITPITKIPSKLQSEKTREMNNDNRANEKNPEKTLSPNNLESKDMTNHLDQIMRDHQEMQIELRETKGVVQLLKKQVSQLEDSNENLVTELNRTQKAFTERIQSLMSEIDEVKKSRAVDAIELKRVKTILMQMDAKYLSKGALNLDPQLGEAEEKNGCQDFANRKANNAIFANAKR